MSHMSHRILSLVHRQVPYTGAASLYIFRALLILPFFLPLFVFNSSFLSKAMGNGWRWRGTVF